MAGWSQEQFLREFSQAIEDGAAALFCGAGTSIPAGMVNWRDLLKPIAADLGLEMDRVTDLLSLAQYGHNQFGRQRLNEQIVTEFRKLARPNPLQGVLVRLPIDVVWTTNYDHTLEDRYREVGKRIDVKINRATLATRLRGADVTIAKIHGDALTPDEAVLTKDDYEGYGSSERGRAFRTALQAALFVRTFLFVGFSFNDPNLEHVLSQVRTLIGADAAREHYCIMTRPRSPAEASGSERAEREYEWRRMELQIEDLKHRYKIRTVLVDAYDDVTSLLQHVLDLSRRKTVFVSGAVERYDPFDRTRLEALLDAIGRRLEADGRRLVSGMGLGVGQTVAQGFALSAYDRGANVDGMTLRPFPQGNPMHVERTNFWTTYRRDLLDRAGFAIYLCGNKLDAASSTIVKSEGMMEEFRIATELGTVPIPIGATGDVAQEISDLVRADLDAYYPASVPASRYLEVLADPTSTNERLVENVFALMSDVERARAS